MLTAFDHYPLAEAGQVLTVYADAVATIEIIPPGVNIRMTYVEIRKVAGVFYRVPVLELIRPLAMCNMYYWQALMAQAQAQTAALSAAPH